MDRKREVCGRLGPENESRLHKVIANTTEHKKNEGGQEVCSPCHVLADPARAHTNAFLAKNAASLSPF